VKNIKKKNNTFIFVFITTILLVGLGIFLFKYLRQEPDTKEIERKWLISSLEDIPYDLSKADKYDIYQSYISFSPEMRLRNVNNGEFYIFTIKSNMSVDGLVRDEVEYYITKEEYEHLLAKKEGVTIHKIRHSIPDGKGNKLQFDVFLDDLDGLVYLEIEFDSEKEAKDYIQPSWVKKDVTSDKRYKNQSLSQFGIPKE